MLIACPACGEHAEQDYAYNIKFCGRDECAAEIRKMKHVPQNMLFCFNCRQLATRILDDEESTPVCDSVACEYSSFMVEEYHRERGS